ncbi:hypothetical protein V1281_005992 [Nitrobacteraceae bacterium AZCC 2161]
MVRRRLGAVSNHEERDAILRDAREERAPQDEVSNCSPDERSDITANFSAEAYRRKAARWLSLWPELTVAPADQK